MATGMKTHLTELDCSGINVDYAEPQSLLAGLENRVGGSQTEDSSNSEEREGETNDVEVKTERDE